METYLTGILVKFKACIAGVLRELICLQIWIQRVQKPPCANFWSNWCNHWCLTAYCNICLITRASDFERQQLFDYLTDYSSNTNFKDYPKTLYIFLDELEWNLGWMKTACTCNKVKFAVYTHTITGCSDFFKNLHMCILQYAKCNVSITSHRLWQRITGLFDRETVIKNDMV